MPTVIAFGAGNVGRGFVGDLFAGAGWDVVFLDVAPALVDALHADRSYIHETVSTEGVVPRTITGVDAAYSSDQEAVDRLLTDADFITTSVGARILPLIAPALAHGLSARWVAGRGPIDILLCENLHGAAGIVRDLLLEHLEGEDATRLDERLGLAETSIGRMIPAAPPEPGQPATLIRVEPYRVLPYDANALKGPEPQVEGLFPVRDVPFAFYSDRKLFLHNMGHCMCAYLGERRGYEYIWHAIGDPEIRALVRAAMTQSALALASRYGADPAALARHIDDLIARFGNRALGDTVERVGRDPIRKLAPEDRILGAYRLAAEQGSPHSYLSLAAAVGTARLAAESEWSDERARAHIEDALFGDADESEDRALYRAQLAALEKGFDWAAQTALLDGHARRVGAI